MMQASKRKSRTRSYTLARRYAHEKQSTGQELHKGYIQWQNWAAPPAACLLPASLPVRAADPAHVRVGGRHGAQLVCMGEAQGL